MTPPYSLWQSSKGTAGFGQVVVKILADCGIIGDDASKTSEMLRLRLGAIDADVRGTVRFSRRGLVSVTSVFFRLMVRPKFLATSEKRLTTWCWVSSVWARRAQSSANSSSVMSS